MTSLVVIIYSGTHIVPVPVVSYRLNPHNSTSHSISFAKAETNLGSKLCEEHSFRGYVLSVAFAIVENGIQGYAPVESLRSGNKSYCKGQNGCKQAACHGNIVNDSSSLRLCSSSWPITGAKESTGCILPDNATAPLTRVLCGPMATNCTGSGEGSALKSIIQRKPSRLSNSSLRSFAVPRLSVMRCARFSIAFSSAESESKPRTATYIVAPKRL